MNIKAKTPSGQVVTIVSFVAKNDVIFAVTVDEDGYLDNHYLKSLVVIDKL